MKYKIVSDSSSNVYNLPGVEFASVPLKIITSAAEYVDTEDMDVEKMVDEIKVTKGRSGTSCPNIGDWLNAFGNAERIFAVTITSRLSGSYAAAAEAAKIYEEAHPDAKVYVVDTLTAGPEMRIIIEFIREKIEEGHLFEDIKEAVKNKLLHTHLIFSLQSLTNLSRNGRVNPAIAKIAGVLGIRILGEAKDGMLSPIQKIRGEAKTLESMFEEMKKRGFNNGRVCIAHCFNRESADNLRSKILSEFPKSRVSIEENGALCSFYAERGGLLVGYEDASL